MTRAVRITLVGVMFAPPAGCVSDAGFVEIPDADYAEFVEQVQPVLSKRCANPSCHGTTRRPLEIYAPSFHRVDPGATHASEPLTDEELLANFDRSRAFLMGANEPDQTLLLSKPLAIAAGGTGHADVDVFETRDDTEYLRLHDWAADALVRSEDPG